MHDEILSTEQIRLLPLTSSFADQFGLVRGTAIALYLGHRRSIDFDFLTPDPINHEKIRKIIKADHSIENILIENPDELTLVVNGVKLTFFRYPFQI